MSGIIRAGRTLAALALLGVAALASGCGDSDDADTQQLTLTSKGGEVVYSDLGEKGPGAGDVRTFTGPLYEEDGTTDAGRIDGSIAVTATDDATGTELENRIGQIVFTLDGGTIVAIGNYAAEPTATVPAEGGAVRAIVGGTGDYEGASGEVTQTADGDDAYRYELDFAVDDDG
jgi:hypothetical protein